MRTTAIRLFLGVAFAAASACGSGEDTEAAPSTDGVPGSGPASVTDGQAALSDQTDNEPTATFPAVSRTRGGNGGVIAVAGELTMEFDYSPPQGHCKASDGKFVARGIGINDDTAGVSITYETVVAPDTGRIVGSVFLFELRKDGYVPWVANAGISPAGSVEDISQDNSPGGDVTLHVTGTVAGFHKNRAPTGTKAPFRLEATCKM